MISVSRRIAAATLAVAAAVVPTTALHARPADVEGAAVSWTDAVLDYLSERLVDLGLREPPRRRASAAPSTAELDPDGQDARPWWDPNGGTVDLLSGQEEEEEARPWWDPNG